MQTCLCWLGQPDWNAVTAVATTVLTIGVWIAFLQLGAQRKASRALEAGQLISMWQGLPISTESELLDRDPDRYEQDRQRVLRLYRHIRGLARFRRFKSLEEYADNFIEDAAQLAERIEIYVRKGVADEGIICEHLGYYVLSGYQILRDVLDLRAREQDYDYEGFRDLALRVQDYAIVFPLDTGFSSGLVWDEIPPLMYLGGGSSQGYGRSFWRKLQLEFALIRDLLQPNETWAADRRDSDRRWYTG